MSPSSRASKTLLYIVITVANGDTAVALPYMDTQSYNGKVTIGPKLTTVSLLDTETVLKGEKRYGHRPMAELERVLTKL